jgi:hypothetical protein
MSTANLAISHLAESQSSKEVTVNAAMDALDGALAGLLAVAMADADQTPSTANALSHIVFECTGALTADRNLILPTNKKLYIVANQTTGGHNIVAKTSAGTGVTIAAADGFVICYCDGTNIVKICKSA